ncbi:DUF4340 domain-containing protein [bacterium]|nr:DUF4340 domain-containing protein [bacterium]
MKKSTIIIIIVFVLLVLVYLLFFTGTKGRKTTTIKDDFLAIDSARVNYIELEGRTGKVIMERQGEQWMITEPDPFEASEEMIGKLLSETRKSTVDNIISENPEKHALFEVDSITGTRALLKSTDGNQTEFIVGKMGSNFSTTYVKLPGSDKVYLVEGRLSNLYNRAPRDWQNKDIIKVNKEAIAGINLFHPEASLKISRAETGDTLPPMWKVEDLNSGRIIIADNQKIDAFLNTVSAFKTNDIITGDSLNVDFENPAFRVEVTLNDGSLVAISGVPKDEEETNYIIKRDDKDLLYSVYKGSARRLWKKLGELEIQEVPEGMNMGQPPVTMPHNMPAGQ